MSALRARRVADVCDASRPEPRAGPNGALTARERRIHGYAELGRSNKLIAHVLGLSQSTVSTHLAKARRKLERSRTLEPKNGGNTRNVGRQRSIGVLTDSAFARNPIVDLTPAERAVVELAVRGLSNAAIARERCSSPRTVANQLAAIYKKLGVGSRRELRARVGR